MSSLLHTFKLFSFITYLFTPRDHSVTYLFASYDFNVTYVHRFYYVYICILNHNVTHVYPFFIHSFLIHTQLPRPFLFYFLFIRTLWPHCYTGITTFYYLFVRIPCPQCFTYSPFFPFFTYLFAPTVSTMLHMFTLFSYFTYLFASPCQQCNNCSFFFPFFTYLFATSPVSTM